MKQSWIQSTLLVAAGAVFLTGCTFLNVPDDVTGDGRSSDPRRELFVIHSLAETISALEIQADADIGTIQADVQYLGAVPNSIIRFGEDLVVTLSGQNELLRLEESNLRVSGRIRHDAGTNPMQTASIDLGNSESEGLLATTQLLAGTVRIDDVSERSWNPPAPWRFPTGPAPQAILSLPGENPEETRLLVANTNFSTGTGEAAPYGEASLSSSIITAERSGGSGTLRRSGDEIIDLEPPDFDPGRETGSNPTVLLDAPTIGEILVVGSGLNYGPDGTGADDGVLITIDRDSLTLGERLHLGGSPGSAVLLAEEPGHRLYVAGPRGIRSIYHDGNSWRPEVREEYDATGGGSALPFIADIAAYENTLYAADFANNAILIFSIRGDGGLSQRGAVDVSQGPIALLVDLE